MPEYTTDPTYNELALLAESAGMTIKYFPFAEMQSDESGIVFAERIGDEFQTEIHMIADDEHYPDQEFAIFTLAHEMAHALMRDFYSEAADYMYREHHHIRQFIEADADKIGAALYRLAEDIAGCKAEAIIRDAAEQIDYPVTGS